MNINSLSYTTLRHFRNAIIVFVKYAASAIALIRKQPVCHIHRWLQARLL